MITKEDFRKLKRGDVIMVGERSPRPRLIQEGPADHDKVYSNGGYITFARKLPSWCSRQSNTAIRVVYNWYDMHYKIQGVVKLSSKAKRLMLRTDAARLKELGQDWRKGMAELIKEEKRLVRCGLNSCRCFKQMVEADDNI